MRNQIPELPVPSTESQPAAPVHPAMSSQPAPPHPAPGPQSVWQVPAPSSPQAGPQPGPQGGAASQAETVEHWSSSLPEEWTATVRDERGGTRRIPLREHPVLAKYANKDEAVKALVHSQRLLGRRAEGLVPPGPGASAEDRDAFFAAIGRPETPEGYALPELDLPEDFALSEELAGKFREAAHAQGLTEAQTAGLYEWFVPLQAEMVRAYHDGRAEAAGREFEALRAQHGGRTPVVLDRAREAALALGGEAFLDALSESGAGDRQEVINAFARLAPLLLEDSLLGGGAGGSEALTREQLMAMQRDPRFSDPLQRDPAFVRQVTEGYRRLYPGKAASGPRG